MGAIGLNPIRLDRIGLDPIRINAIKLGVPGASGSDRPYIDPEVLASLKAVCICYGKSNDDPDRAVVKNLVDPDNPFVISNAAFKLNSGFGKYEEDFTDWEKSPKVTSFDGESIKFTSDVSWVLLYHPSSIGEDIPSFKVRIKLYGEGTLYYNYITQEGTYTNVTVKSEIFETPICYNTKYTGEKGVNVGFTLGVRSGECSGTITQIPSFEGAFVTDGINDLITSTKTVQEMLGGSNEITVVSMMANLDSRQILCNSNFSNTNGYNVRNTLEPNGVITMLGYTDKNGTTNNLNLIMGDKDSIKLVDKVNFNSDYVFYPAQYYKTYYQVAWYWTIIANKVLTTDQINQVIAYFNLDRTLKPDILCDIEKQGITNENHAEFGDKLIDFSGNGRDIQLNNIAWKGDSGIGKYETDFTTWLLDLVVDITIKYSSFNIKTKNDSRVNTWVVRTQDTVTPSMKIKVTGISSSVESLIYRYSVIDDTNYYIDITSDGIYELPQTNGKGWEGFRVIGKNFNISVEQIPSHAGALCLDGVDDFGKVTGMPVYKDYTFIIDRQIISIGDTAGVVASKSEDSADATKHGAFIFEYLAAPDKISTWSFYKNNGQVANTDFTRGISYQSTYSYNGKDLTIGTSKDSDKLWLGTIRDNDSRFFNGAIYSLMSFPYSMSEFLIERQLKKHKLGTLYPDMVEFRPIVKSNLPYSSITYSVNPGEYISVDSMVTITVTLPNTSDKLMEVSCNAISDISISGDNGVYEITGKIVKSPQKINLVISSYLTMLSNSTLISNETLIKNE